MRFVGYVIFRMRYDGRVEEVPSFGLHDDMSLVNYAMVPRCELNAFRERFLNGRLAA
jgi:hypothetical protein